MGPVGLRADVVVAEEHHRLLPRGVDEVHPFLAQVRYGLVVEVDPVQVALGGDAVGVVG